MNKLFRSALLLLALTSSASALDYTFLLDGERTPMNAFEEGGKVFVEANKFGRYLGPILDRVIDVNAVVGAVTDKIDLGPLGGLFGALVNRAANQAKYEVIRRAEEPFVEVHAFARGQGAQLVYHPFDKTFVIARDAAGLARGEEARDVSFGTAKLRLDDARLKSGALALTFVTNADEATARSWTFVGDGAVLTVDGVSPAEGGLTVTLALGGAVPRALVVHGDTGRASYDLSSLR